MGRKIIICGIAPGGKPFRPSDWAERMSGPLCEFKNHRMEYSPLLQPGVRHGQKCVIIDSDLEKNHATLYEDIMAFAKKNRLKIEFDDN